MINETYFSVMFHETRLPESPAALLFSLLLPLSVCRVKKTTAGDNDGRQNWFSVPVPPSSGCSLQVKGLSPATEYQFSILSHNKMGTGPFSEITVARTSGQYDSPVSPKTVEYKAGLVGIQLQVCEILNEQMSFQFLLLLHRPFFIFTYEHGTLNADFCLPGRFNPVLDKS